VPKITFLTIEQILLIHEDQVERYGGSSGMRDLSLLESAVYRPQTTFNGTYLYASIYDMTAVLIHSLILNHPFVDANKRVGMVAGIVFLAINNYELLVSEHEFLEIALKITEKEISTEELSSWLLAKCKER
jgi:death-on-curing protein